MPVQYIDMLLICFAEGIEVLSAHMILQSFKPQALRVPFTRAFSPPHQNIVSCSQEYVPPNITGITALVLVSDVAAGHHFTR